MPDQVGIRLLVHVLHQSCSMYEDLEIHNSRIKVHIAIQGLGQQTHIK